MAFSDDYADILLPFVEKYKTAKNEKARAAVVKNAADAVSKSSNLREGEAVKLPKDLPTAISRYIKACIKNESSNGDEDPIPNKVKQTYKIRDVIKQVHRERIEEAIPYQSTDKEYLGCYQRAVTTIQNGLSNDELKEAESILVKWNAMGAPPDMQQKRAKTKLPGEIKKKIEEWKFTSGALVMCLVAYSDGKEVQGFQLVIQSISDNKHLNTIFSVESSPNVSMAFTNAYPEWREGTYENFKDWSLKQFDAEKLDSDDEAEIPAHMQKAKDIEFKKDGSGEFILPPKTEFKTNRAKQRVVRGYLGAVYRDFTGYDKAAFPYLLAGEEGQKLFSPDCVPDGFILIDPDHLKAFEIDALYSHWLRRQSKGLSPFIILQSSPQHGVLRKKSEKAKGKKKIDYVEVDMDDEEVKTSEDEEVDKNANEMEELDEEIPAVVRFGPPGGNRKKTKTIENPSQAAGPSKLSPVKKSSEPKTKKGSKTRPEVGGKKEKKTKKSSSQKNIDDDDVSTKAGGEKPVGNSSRKRKAEEGEEVPSKRKRGGGGESNLKMLRKRKNEEQEESPSKRICVGKGESEKTQPSSSHQPQGGGRQKTRVKEYPAGNAMTSSSRISFLRSLSTFPGFQTLVDLVPTVPAASPIPKNFPSWASWKSRDVFLPAEFHSSSYFNKTLQIAKDLLEDSTVLQGSKVDSPLLLVGLMYREVSRAIEIEPDDPTQAPSHLVNSTLGIQQIKKIENLLKSLAAPS